MCRLADEYVDNYLHSTMYLFQLFRVVDRICAIFNLHSTMYLFQLVSAKNTIKYNLNLHSTMYLFQQLLPTIMSPLDTIYIPLCIYFNQCTEIRERTMFKFTFHYVSISTAIFNSVPWRQTYLHSTMYLFQLQCRHHDIQSAFIYIPLCIYFNASLSKISHNTN